MKRAAALVLVASLASSSVAGCGFAKRHPAITIGITSAVIAEGTCELATEEHLTCLAISGGVGLGLAGIVALALLLGGPGDTVLSGSASDPDEPPPPEVPQDPTLDEPVQVPAEPAPVPVPAEPSPPPPIEPPAPPP